MKIYEYTDHRALIRDLMQHHKTSKPDLTYAKLAEGSGLTSSFLSQVLGGDQEFSNDQIYAIGLFFSFDAEELDYLVLLNEYHRCQLSARKGELLQQIEKIQNLHLRVIEYLSYDRIDMDSSPADEILSDTIAPIVEAHIFLEKNLKNPWQLQKELNIDPDHFARILDLLVRANIIQPDGDGYRRVVNEVMHYKINTAAKFNAVYSRLKAVEKTFADDPTDLISTLIFCANDDFIHKVKAQLLAFQDYAISHYESTTEGEVYFINVDLFPVEGGA